MEYTIYYRNYLRYCNYKCTYCPFSKYKLNNNDLEKDKIYFRKFTDFLKKVRINLEFLLHLEEKY